MARNGKEKGGPATNGNGNGNGKEKAAVPDQEPTILETMRNGDGDSNGNRHERNGKRNGNGNGKEKAAVPTKTTILDTARTATVTRTATATQRTGTARAPATAKRRGRPGARQRSFDTATNGKAATRTATP